MVWLYLILGVIWCVLLSSSYHSSNFHCKFWWDWPIELSLNESGPKNICHLNGLEHAEVVAPIVIPWNPSKSIFVFWPYNEIIPFQEGHHNLVREPHGLYFQTCSNIVLPINDEEFSICDIIPICWLLLYVRHDTKCLLDIWIRHINKVVQRLIHAMPFKLPNCLVLWVSHHLIYWYGVQPVNFKDKAVLAFCPKFLVHYIYLIVVHFLTWFK